ncbi:transcriptional regulator [Bradyrhizobium sp. 1200_D9_N1_1]|uniref:transcriptional regulator n=1 Tax=Bradyrhizobium sp. 1200_D9_N1_1 TaxID=3239013 RepID=UPI003F894F8A
MSNIELAAPGRLAYSISEFCQAVGVSRSYFYTLSDEAKPRMVKRGGRWFIPTDAAREWLSTAGIAA